MDSESLAELYNAINFDFCLKMPEVKTWSKAQGIERVNHAIWLASIKTEKRGKYKKLYKMLSLKIDPIRLSDEQKLSIIWDILVTKNLYIDKNTFTEHFQKIGIQLETINKIWKEKEKKYNLIKKTLPKAKKKIKK